MAQQEHVYWLESCGWRLSAVVFWQDVFAIVQRRAFAFSDGKTSWISWCCLCSDDGEKLSELSSHVSVKFDGEDSVDKLTCIVRFRQRCTQGATDELDCMCHQEGMQILCENRVSVDTSFSIVEYGYLLERAITGTRWKKTEVKGQRRLLPP
jgi:hypothetical protein